MLISAGIFPRRSGKTVRLSVPVFSQADADSRIHFF
jgi:hypothetical protein